MKKKVKSSDYAQREYGVSKSQVQKFEKVTERQYQRLKKAGKLVTISLQDLKKLLE